MSSKLVKRIERLEEELKRERASRMTWEVVWIEEPGAVGKAPGYGNDSSRIA
jgi:hypothetical protein